MNKGCGLMYYKHLFPNDKEIRKNRKFPFLIGECEYVLYNNIAYIDDSLGDIPKAINVITLSNYFYNQHTNKKFILPLLNKNIVTQLKKIYKSAYIKPWAIRNIVDDIMFPETTEIWEYISPLKKYEFFANTLYISTKTSYLTALMSLFNVCNTLVFVDHKHTFDGKELKQFCDFFDIPYRQDDNIIYVDIKINKQHVLDMYEQVSFEQHLKDVLNDKFINYLTLTEYLNEVFSK